jgi:hypothetical protein
MANFKLTELNSIQSTGSDDLIYIVQNDLSKNITIESTFNNLPVNVSTRGNFDINEPGINGGQYLSGGQPIETTLTNTFALNDSSQIIELLNINNEAFIWPTEGEALSSFSNYCVFLSGGLITGDVPQRLTVELDPRFIPDGFYIKLVQSGGLPIFLSAGDFQTNSGELISVNNTLTSGPTEEFGDNNFNYMEIFKMPVSNGQDRIVVTHRLSSNGEGVDPANWK